jgi:hypothetical protein
VATKCTSAYKIRYRSLKRLNQDHESHITHGGILVPKSGVLPLVNTKSLLRLETPSGAYFDFPALIVREMPGHGFVAAFEAEAKGSQLALDELIITEEFKQACEAEEALEGPPVAVVLIDLEDIYATPPQPAANTPQETLDESPPPVTPEQLSDAVAEQVADTIRGPEPGEALVVYVLTYVTLLDYQTVLDDFTKSARLTVPYENEAAKPGDAAELRINLPGKNVFNVMGRIEAVDARSVTVRVSAQDPTYQAAVSFPRTTRGQKRLASELDEHRGPIKVARLQTEAPRKDDDKMPLRRRLQRMSMDDKVNLALSGDREVRMALASDGNKAIHHYLLKNARTSMDEIVMMARLPTLNPDVLMKIGENPAYTQNPQVVRNLVFNPKTPVKLAVRLIDRLPKSVLNLIAKRTSMHRSIVSAAQKKLGRKS